MKIIILLFLTVMAFIGGGIELEAATFKFMWLNTIVRIPVGDELSKYIEIPKARLYRDGVVLADANITYASQGDWLYFLKDVDTSKVGSYQVWYKAFENDKYRPGTCQGYKCLVTFVVYDNIEPEIIILEDEIYRDRGYMHGEGKDKIDLDLLNNVSYKDNYSKNCKITLNHQVNYDFVGRYEVKVNLIDEAGNSSKASFYVNVLEKQLPIITYLGPVGSLKIGLNKAIDISKYFEAHDHQYGDISKDIVYPVIDTSKVGSYKYTPYVIKDGLRAECEITIEIVDDVEPELILTTHNIILGYNEDFSLYDFKKYVKGVNDNTSYNEENLFITHDLENMVGNYHIFYKYTDGIYTVEDTIDVVLISKERPIIEVMDVYLDSSSGLDLTGFINIIDESDPNIYESLVIDDSMVDYSKPGSYVARAYCINSSGLSTTKQFRVIINGGSESDFSVYLYAIVGVTFVLLITLIIFIIIYFIYKKRHKAL